MSKLGFPQLSLGCEETSSVCGTFQSTAMKFAIVGAGAIGAFAGAMLDKSGEDVTLIARGAHLRAMQERGVRVRGSLGEFEARPSATEDPATIGPVDVVLLTLKAHSLTEMAPRSTPPPRASAPELADSRLAPRQRALSQVG